MLGNADALATLAVKDLTAAAEFYERKVGLKKLASEEKEVLVYQSGNTRILVYQSQFAGTNKATAATWAVDDVDGEVRDLKSKGVVFEQYDFPGVTREGDVHVFGKRRNAWFKDPDGNILSITSRS
jgi:catechol 2,3-dioxygenase-like lactoylglutathione lyase family enzyme